MHKGSIIVILSVFVFISGIVIATVFRPVGVALYLAGPAMFGAGLYIRGPQFRRTHKKSFISMILGISLYFVWVGITLAFPKMWGIAYMPSAFALILLAGFCLFLYGVISYFRSPYFKIKHNANSLVRAKAFDKINDEHAFRDVVMDSDREEIRKDALRRINNPQILAEILMNSQHEDVREEAVKKITDEDVLRRYVSLGRSDSAEFFAKSVLNKEEVLDERNFNYLNHLIINGEKEITLDSDISLESLEAEYFKEGVAIDGDDIIIDGNGFSIDADGKLPFFTVTGKNITFRNLKFKNGCSNNISNKGEITFLNCLFEGNSDCVLLNHGSAKLEDCIFVNNEARVIRNIGGIKMDNCTFSDNIGVKDRNYEHDHIIYNRIKLECEDCVFKNNNGGAILNWGSLSVTDCAFEENSHEKFGGAIRNDGSTNNKSQCAVSDCVFIKNFSKLGGAISSTYSRVTIDECYFKENSCETSGTSLLNSRFSKCTFSNSKFEDEDPDLGVIYNFGGLGKTAYDGMMGHKAVDAALLRYHNLEFVNCDKPCIINDDGKIEEF